MPAGVSEDLPRVASFSRAPIIRHQNPFKITVTRRQLPAEASGIRELLLQVYSPEKGRWIGYGLMRLRTERVKGGAPRVAGGTIDFHAPAEGIYCLRTVARDRTGHLQEKAKDLSDVEWVVVMDRTPPKVTLLSPAPGEGAVKPGKRLEIRWGAKDAFPIRDTDPGKARSNVVSVSHDGGLSWREIAARPDDGEPVIWRPEGPNTDAMLIRVEVTDAAGNVGMATLGGKLRVSGFKGPLLARKPSAARRTYQRGVIYMTRGDYLQAARQFEEAIRLDTEQKLLRAWVDLSATYLQLYDAQVRIEPRYAATYLERAKSALDKALSIEGFAREVSLHYNLAQVHYRYRKMGEAAASLLRGLALKPRHIESLYMLALVRWNEGKTAEARKLWRQVAALGGAIRHPLAPQAVRCLDLVHEAERGSEPEKVSARTSSYAGDRIR